MSKLMYACESRYTQNQGRITAEAESLPVRQSVDAAALGKPDPQGSAGMRQALLTAYMCIAVCRYWHADTIGMLVWQDQVSMCGMYAAVGGDSGYPTCWNRTDTGDHVIPDYAVDQFNHELQMMITKHQSFPSIIFYEVFNEGWGEFPAAAESITFAKCA